ncbi:unnamed protein product [Urochloa decumbens]|uniref:Uncharacterized protein n=1 Tax=Urochloa decumbens TaxID=240449 RepID=A0ABC8YWR1_9POAL
MSNTAVTTPSAAAPTMKLLVDTKSNRVVFAEAGKDVADFILGLLAMPIGAVPSLLRAADVLASVGKMADDAYMQQSTATRECLLLYPSPAYPTPFSAAAAGAIRASRGTCICADSKYACQCHCQARRASCFPEGGNEGLVQGEAATYIIMDDLAVTPTTANVSRAALLKEFGGGVKDDDIDALEERTVDVGNEEALKIIKAALHSRTVLTDAFIHQGGGEEEEGRPASCLSSRGQA